MTSTVLNTLTRVATEVTPELDALSAQLLTVIELELPILIEDPPTRDLLRSTVTENLRSALAVFRSLEHRVDVSAPPVALDFARRLAQRDVPIAAMLRAYRLGQAAFQQFMIARIAATDVTAEQVAAASMELSSVAFSFIDRVSEEVVATYLAERDTWMRHGSSRRLAAVTALLGGQTTDLGSAERTIGYRLDQDHVAAIIWIAEPIPDSGPTTALERALADLASASHTSGPALSVTPDGSTLWAWLASGSLHPDGLRLRDPEIRIALGEPANGFDGFRSSHASARAVRDVVLAADPAARRPVTAPGDVGPLLLMSGRGAASWVRSVLGELATDDESHARLRETVAAYLAAGGSLATAAAELHVHRNTVQYRLQKAELARGRSLHDDRLSLEVALLACVTLGAAVLVPA